jgi:hypothetical protein
VAAALVWLARCLQRHKVRLSLVCLFCFSQCRITVDEPAIVSALVAFLPGMVNSLPTSHFKADPTKWGVTAADDERLAAYKFGDYKSDARLDGEQQLINYMCNFTQSRESGLRDFNIALAVAAAGTGKTRLIDDMLRVSLPASADFTHILRLGFSFNGNASVVCKLQVASRAVREFFCGPAQEGDGHVLKAIGTRLVTFFNSHASNLLNLELEPLCQQLVLRAVEALFAQQQNASIDQCRVVLLIDEVAASQVEEDVYDIVKMFVDGGVVPGESKSRRGAFFTGLKIVSPWTKVTPTGRTIVQIPLGTIDLWADRARVAIAAHAQTLWPGMGAIPDRAWSLLAATGGRPRDIVRVLSHIETKYTQANLATADQRMLLNALVMDADWSELFAQYLLPSMLNVSLYAYQGTILTPFGRAAPMAALLNADLLATTSGDVQGVPAVSFRFAHSIPDGLPDLPPIVNALVASTTVCVLDGSGKDFERVWIGLKFLHLLLQYAVRKTEMVAAQSKRFARIAVKPAAGRLGKPNAVFWPVGDELSKHLVPLPSTDDAIDVFASNDPSQRINALFPCPDERRVHQATYVVDENRHSVSIHRKVSLREPPSLAVWGDLWLPTVAPGNLDALPAGWPAKSVVQWKPGTVVYLSKSKNAAVDSLLLVGEPKGVGENEPHVYLFQFKARAKNVTLGTKTRWADAAPTEDVEEDDEDEDDEDEDDEDEDDEGEECEVAAAAAKAATVHAVVENVWRHLDNLFSNPAMQSHVLRQSGINRMAQVTLCICVLKFGPSVDLKAAGAQMDAPFSVVLFDAENLVNLAGPSFKDTLFFRKL